MVCTFISNFFTLIYLVILRIMILFNLSGKIIKKRSKLSLFCNKKACFCPFYYRPIRIFSTRDADQSWDWPDPKILDLAKLLVAYAPKYKKNCFTPSQINLKFGSKNRLWFKGLTLTGFELILTNSRLRWTGSGSDIKILHPILFSHKI